MWLLGETGQVPTVEVPGTALPTKRGRFSSLRTMRGFVAGELFLYPRLEFNTRTSDYIHNVVTKRVLLSTLARATVRQTACYNKTSYPCPRAGIVRIQSASAQVDTTGLLQVPLT